jgi:hypothetical protein
VLLFAVTVDVIDGVGVSAEVGCATPAAVVAVGAATVGVGWTLFVAVGVGTGVAVFVGVAVGVCVGVAVAVGVAVGVGVAVFVGVGVQFNSGGKQRRPLCMVAEMIPMREVVAVWLEFCG